VCRDLGFTHMEGLINLDKLIGKGPLPRSWASLCGSRGGTGSPIRAVAWLDDLRTAIGDGEATTIAIGFAAKAARAVLERQKNGTPRLGAPGWGLVVRVKGKGSAPEGWHIHAALVGWLPAFRSPLPRDAARRQCLR